MVHVLGAGVAVPVGARFYRRAGLNEIKVENDVFLPAEKDIEISPLSQVIAILFLIEQLNACRISEL